VKVIYCILILFSCSVFGNYTNTYLLDREDSQVNPHQNQAGNRTTAALLSIDEVQERADYFVYKFKQLTFGEYSDDVMIIAPFITGRVEFSANRFNLYYSHFQNEGGVNYNLSF